MTLRTTGGNKVRLKHKGAININEWRRRRSRSRRRERLCFFAWQSQVQRVLFSTDQNCFKIFMTWQSRRHDASRHKLKANSTQVLLEQHNTFWILNTVTRSIFQKIYSFKEFFSPLFLLMHLFSSFAYFAASLPKLFVRFTRRGGTFVSVASLDPESADAVHVFHMSVHSTPIPTAWKLALFDLNPLLSAEDVFIYQVFCCFSSW